MRSRSLWLLGLAFALLASLHGSSAQDHSGDTEHEDADEHPQPKVFSPNPPACADRLASVVWDATEIGVRIVTEAKLCAAGAFWGSMLPYTNLPEWNQPTVCGESIVLQLSFWAKMLSDFFSVMFNCFNNNQACGQAVAGSISAFLRAALSLMQAVKLCEPPGEYGDDWVNKDIPVNGLNCWGRVWNTVRWLMTAAKSIDVALSGCPKSASQALMAPPPPAASTADGGGASGDNSSNSSAEDAAPLMARAVVEREEDAWAALEQPRPWSAQAVPNPQLAVGALERRRLRAP